MSLLPRWSGVLLAGAGLFALAWFAALAGFYLNAPAAPRGDGWYLFQSVSLKALEVVTLSERLGEGQIHSLHRLAILLAWCAVGWLILAGALVTLRRPIAARLVASVHGHVLVGGTGAAVLEALLANKASKTPTLALLPRMDTALQASLDHHHIPWELLEDSNTSLNRTLRCPGASILASDESDTVNIGLLERISGLLAHQLPAKGVSLIVRISDGRLRTQISGRLMTRSELSRVRLVLYSDHDLRARLAARLVPAFRFCHAQQPDSAHLVIVGRGYPAESMLVQLLKTMHFPRGKTVRISIANETAPTLEADYQSRFPQLARHYPVTFHQLDVSNGADWAGWLMNQAQAGKRPTAWYFVHDNSATELQSALAVEEAYSMLGEITPPLVLLSADDGTSGNSLLSDAPMLKAVGDVTRVEGGELISQARMDAMATVIQQSYLEQCFAAGELAGDRPTLYEWAQLPEIFKDENRDQAEHNQVKLLLLGLSPVNSFTDTPLEISDAELEILSIAEHDRWLACRRSRNWVYAEERDDDRRRHPDMVAWSDLPEPRREIDRDMVRNLSNLVTRMKLQLKKRVYCRLESTAPLKSETARQVLRQVQQTLSQQYPDRLPVVAGRPDDALVNGLLSMIPTAEYLAIVQQGDEVAPLLARAQAMVAEPTDDDPATLSRLVPDLTQDWLQFRCNESGDVVCQHTHYASSLPEES